MSHEDRIRNAVRGAFAGAVIGNVLGRPFRGMTPEEISDLTGGRGASDVILTADGAKRLGLLVPEDDLLRPDASMMHVFGTAESLIRSSGFDVSNQAKTLTAVYGIEAGGSLSFRTVAAMSEIMIWQTSGGVSGRDPASPAEPTGDILHLDCDAVLRSMPLTMFQAVRGTGSAEAIEELEQLCAITHGEPMVLLAAAGLAPLMTWPFAHHYSLVNSRLVLEEAMRNVDLSMRRILTDDEATKGQYAILYSSFGSAIAGVYDHHKLRSVTGARLSLQETVPFVVLCALRNARDYEYAIMEAANAGGDTSASATLVGAIVGANVGLDDIPAGYREVIPEVSRAVDLADRLVDAVNKLTADADKTAGDGDGRETTLHIFPPNAAAGG